MERIYMDHAATTPMDIRVAEAMTPIFAEVFGNPSSVHAYGRAARRYLDEARRTMARSIHADEKKLFYERRNRSRQSRYYRDSHGEQA